MDVHKLFAKVVNVLKEHASFLDATEKNLSYFLIGKKANITSSSTFPTLDLINFFSTYVNVAESHNVLSYLVGNFMEEISNTNFVLNITPYPVRQEPFLSFCDVLEDYIFKIHRDNKRKNLIKGMVLELFAHGYVGFYSDGIHYYPLSAFDLIPGDPSIKEIQDQPFVVRRTKILVADLLNNKYAIPESLNDSLKRRDPLSYCNLYDVWVKSEDLNVVFTDDGKVLYQQKFPYPKIYPFFVANDANLVNYFYTVPLMSLLAPLQDKYVESIQNLEDSSKSISKPLLVYDTDAGIDENKLLYALKKGYKQIIVEKNREGNIQFLAPGYLPNYATELPMFILNELMHQVGISEAFLGMAPGSVRERGAMSSLISASFRRVYSKASLLETLFSDLDFYLIEYLREHKLKIKFPFEHSEEILTYNTFFIPDEHFYGFGSEDTTNSQVLTLRKWQQKLISQKQALSELGYPKPSRILKDQLSENELMTKSMQRLQSQIQAKPRTPLEEIAHRLRVSHIKDFYLKPISDDKVLINCKDKDKSQISFLLSDLSNNFLIESSKKIFNATIAQPRETSQEELDKISQQGKEIENAFSELNQAQGKNPQQTQSNSPVSGETVEVPSQKKTRGRPKEKIIPEKEVELKKPTPRNLGEAPEDKNKSEKDSLQPRNSIQEEQKEETSLSGEQIVIMMSELLRKSQTSIKDHKRYLDLPGLYLVEPHASWIYDGKKTMIIKSKKYDVENKSYLLCGDLVYGVIIFHRVLPCSPQMFKDFQKYHFISDKEVEKWGWKDKPLYLYLFEFHKFIKPLNYKKESGVQTFIKKVEIIKNPKLEFGVPQTGDLKPMEIKPWKVPPPHKPEKKALQPQEVFSVKRLKDILPEGTWDVSEKCITADCPLIIKNKKGEIRIGFPNNIKPGMEILTHRGRFRKVNRVFTRYVSAAKEKIFEIRNHAIAKFWITGNHRVLADDGSWIPIQEIPERKEVGKPSFAKAKNSINEIDLEFQGYHKKVPLNSSTLWLLGFWIAEGSNYLNNEKVNGRVVFANKDINLIDKASRIIEKYWLIKPKVYTNKKVGIMQLYFVDIGFSRFLAANFKAEEHHEKTLPDWISELSNSQFRSLLKGWQDGDGNLRTNSIATSSPYAAATLCIQLWKHNISYSFSYHRTSFKPAFTIFLDRKQKITFRWKKQIKHLKNKVKVFNFEVEEDNSYVTPNLCLHNCDGLRCRIWKVGNKVKAYSDQGNEFKSERIKPILDDIIKYFPVDVLLDGELMMESTERKDIAGYIHSNSKPTSDELNSLCYYVWDILYVKNQSIASKPFQIRSSVLDLYLKGRKGRIIRVKHLVVSRDKVPEAVKKVASKEGAIIREVHASYWATHLSFKVKWVYDLDCKVVAVEQTKLGLPIFHCVLRDGTYIGQTYAQAEVKAKPGDVIRVNVNHITLRPDGSIGWFAPRPKSFKEGKISPNRPSLTQVGIGGPDSLDLVKEIYFASGGTEKKWKDWYPKHLDWKKNTMPKLLSEIKRKIREGIPSSKT